MDGSCLRCYQEKNMNSLAYKHEEIETETDREPKPQPFVVASRNESMAQQALRRAEAAIDEHMARGAMPA